MQIQMTDRAIRSMLDKDIAAGTVIKAFDEGRVTVVSPVLDAITSHGVTLLGKRDRTGKFFTVRLVRKA